MLRGPAAHPVAGAARSPPRGAGRASIQGPAGTPPAPRPGPGQPRSTPRTKSASPAGLPPPTHSPARPPPTRPSKPSLTLQAQGRPGTRRRRPRAGPQSRAFAGNLPARGGFWTLNPGGPDVRSGCDPPRGARQGARVRSRRPPAPTPPRPRRRTGSGGRGFTRMGNISPTHLKICPIHYAKNLK